MGTSTAKSKNVTAKPLRFIPILDFKGGPEDKVEEKMTKNTVISFMGIKPKPGDYFTSNRHNCMGKSQISVHIGENGEVKTLCPCCRDNPPVFFECGEFSFFGGKIL